MITKQRLIYKDYHGSVNFSVKDNIWFGKVLGIHSLISYEGRTFDALQKDFEEAIDDYLFECKEHQEMPENPALNE